MTNPVVFRLSFTVLVTILLLATGGRPAAAKGVIETCTTAPNDADKCTCLLQNGGPDDNLSFNFTCNVPAGSKVAFGNVNIIAGGTLNFLDGGDTHFWAKSILVENGGTLSAGSLTAPIKNGRVTIHLYGAPQGRNGTGALCVSPNSPETCGAPAEIFFSNVTADHMNVKPRDQAVKVKDLAIGKNIKDGYPGVKDDYFYTYHPLFHDGGDHNAYFGYKVLGVGYGGTLQLFGAKGGCYAPGDTNCSAPDFTGRSWVRLNATVQPGASQLTVEVPPGLSADGLGWKEDDFIVLTTTDYLPGHSELLKVLKVDEKTNTVFLKDTATFPVKYIHNGKRFPLDDASHPGISRVGLSTELTTKGAETRAAVGLLTRNIRIVSEGDKVSADRVTTTFPAETSTECTSRPGPETNKCYFGGHTVFRQGAKTVQIQGVEFYQLGQGGRIGHYPVHFHHARKTHRVAANEKADDETVDTSDPEARVDATDALDTFVLDSAIWDSMTRWIVLHGTQDVTLARNVGYKSIGHGFYLEDATEINNKLLANLGVFARAAVDNDQNPRKVPGILAAPDQLAAGDAGGAENTPFRSDYDHPTVFWIMNAYNDFQFNMAAGAGMCGACYWIPGPVISTMSRDLKWESYAAIQDGVGRSAMAPLKSFVGNACTTAMTSLQTVTVTEGCKGLADFVQATGTTKGLPPIPNPLAANAFDFNYYPTLNDGGFFPTLCPAGRDCTSPDFNTGAPRCGENNPNCVVTTIDRYTTSFNWAALNFAGVWLRPWWYLMTDSVITDPQQAGLTFITGGGYDAASVIPGHWALLRRSALIGSTQDCPTCEIKDNPYASNGGPFNPKSGITCEERTGGTKPGTRPESYCLSIKEGISHQISNFGMYQRLFNVYDGPAFQDSNAYINITNRTLDDCAAGPDGGGGGTCVPTAANTHKNSTWVAGVTLGLPRDAAPKTTCFMPNAAIGWKQPNGFYYPPAFHSTNLFFENVDNRHFVITPLFKEDSLVTDVSRVQDQYCVWNPGLFSNFNSNDQQTVLNDDDGSLTGYKNTTVTNLDDFFAAPVDAIQCRSEGSSRTSPYEYVTTVIYPHCASTNPRTCAKQSLGASFFWNDGDWNSDCTAPFCYGIPLYRQDQMPISDKGKLQSIRMMGQQIGQRSSLTVNNGTYYVDTSLGKAKQCSPFDVATCTSGAKQQGDQTLPGINLFKANETYYLFLIFAKPETVQHYQVYVGPVSAKPAVDPITYLNLQIGQAEIKTVPVGFSNFTTLPAGKAKWLNDDQSTGVVVVDFAVSDLPGLSGLFTQAKKNKCQPATYCQASADGNSCNGINGGLDAACKWAIADLDCPAGGCVSLKWTMPAAFATDPSPNPRPAPACIDPVKRPEWATNAIDLKPAASNIAGDCFNAPQLTKDFCSK